MGPSLSGKTTQAQRLAKTKNLYYFRVEDVIANFIHSSEELTQKYEKPTPDTRDEVTLVVYKTLIVKFTLSQDVLLEIFTQKLKSPECDHGIVVDGLYTPFTAQDQVAQVNFSTYLTHYIQALLHALEAVGRSPQVFFFKADVSTIKERRAQEFYSDEYKIVQKLRELLSISEEKYDAMTPQQQQEFEEAKREIKHQRREEQDRRKKLIQLYMKPKSKERLGL